MAEKSDKYRRERSGVKAMRLDLFGLYSVPMPTYDASKDATSDATEFKIPVALLIAGLAIIFGYALVVAGPSLAKAVILMQVIGLAIMIPLGIVACYITAKLLSIDFGDVRSASAKLAAIFTFPSAVALLIPWGPVAWLVSVLLYLGLLTWLFDMEGWDPLICAIVIWLVRIAATIIAGVVLSSM